MIGAGTTTDVFVACQPILGVRKDVFGYELLFRSSASNKYDATDGDASTLNVIANSLVDIGLHELTGGRRGFVNFSRNLLLEDTADLLPPDQVVIEILENVEPDEEVLARCRHLREAGYLLALDDFVAARAGSPLLDVADLVKVDFVETTAGERTTIVADLKRRNIKALAEKVETEGEFLQAADEGFTYFQGYFFSKPVIQTGKAMTGSKLAHLRLMKQVNEPELSFDDMEAIIKQDVSLTYKLLRFINSVWFALRYKIDSVRHALVWLGRTEIRRWFYLVTLLDMGTDKPTELYRQTMTRAKMAELLAPSLGLQSEAQRLFLMGMFSTIDVLLDVRIEDVLDGLPLDDEVKAALVGKPGKFRDIHEMIGCYERGDWDAFSDRATRLGLDPAAVPAIYKKALKWARQALEVA